MGFSPISGLQTPQQQLVQELSEQTAQKSHFSGIQDNGLLPPQENSGVGDTSHVPDAPTTTNVNPAAVTGLCSTLSPGAWIAILCVKDAAQEIQQGTTEIMNRTALITEKMNKQADNIMSGAIAQLVCTVATSAVSIGLSAGAWGVTKNISTTLKPEAFQKAMAYPSMLSSIGRSLEQIGGSVGGFVSTLYQSENKKLDAGIEQARSIIDTVRTHMQAQHDLVNKSLDFYNSMQANINQTRAKILG